jgi:hypothetical protein
MDIRNRLGRTVAQAVLRDNGRDFDSKPSDGEWTAPVSLQLPAGSYSVQVTVNTGTERFSRHGEFAVTTAATTVPRPNPEPDPLPVIKEQLGQLTAVVHALASNRSFPAAAWISLLALGVAGLAVGLTLRRRPMKQPLQPPGPLRDIPPAPEANWKPLFGCLDGIQSAVTSMKGDLSSTYQMQRRALDERIRLARELVSLSRSMDSAETLSSDLTQALKANLDELLLTAGVARWDPETGSPAPPESEQRFAKSHNGGPPLSVTRVLSPGFRLRDGESWRVLVRPVVEVIAIKHGAENA